MFHEDAATIGAGNVVTLSRLFPTPAGPSPMHTEGIPRLSLPLTWPMHAEIPVPWSSSCSCFVR